MKDTNFGNSYYLDLNSQGYEFSQILNSEPLFPSRSSCLALVSSAKQKTRHLQLSKEGSSYDRLTGIEDKLKRLSRQGKLATSRVIFGSKEDPFHPFEGKFDISLKVLKLFENYEVGHLLIQTRSPLVVIAIPRLKNLSERLTVSIPVESNMQSVFDAYCPGLPRIQERLSAAKTLRAFGIEVVSFVQSVLPYGDWRTSVMTFAKVLVDSFDYLSVHSLTHEDEKNLRVHPVAVRLANARQFHYLRPDAHRPLFEAISQINAKKLIFPERTHMRERQLSIFAA